MLLLSQDVVNMLQYYIASDLSMLPGCLCITYGRWESWQTCWGQGHLSSNGYLFSSTGNHYFHIEIMVPKFDPP